MRRIFSNGDPFFHARKNKLEETQYDLFLEMTERYLSELLSTMNYEKAIIESLGEEKGNEVIEKVATSNPVINALDSENGKEEEIRNKNTNLFNAIEKMQSSSSSANYIGIE